MAAFFASVSSQRLVNSTPAITTYPFSVAVWAYPTTTGAIRNCWSLGDTAVTTHYFTLGQNSSNAWRISASDGTNTNTLAGTVTADKWTFIVGRFISATNRRISVLHFDGSTIDSQNTLSRIPLSVDTMYLGARVALAPQEFFDGLIGEFWYTNTDIQADGDALQSALLRQLAYGGPFSVPHVAKNIIEYRTLRVHPDSRGDSLGEIYHGAAGRQTWSNTNGVTTGPHPPLPYCYEKPVQSFRCLTV